MRATLAAALLLFSGSPTGLLAQAAPVAAPAGHYSVEDTDIGTMLDDPAAKAILDKHIPGFSKGDQIDMARGMTLKAIEPYAGDQVTDKVLADIQADLNALPAKSK
jgi:para-nitrobenzyl esterase